MKVRLSIKRICAACRVVRRRGKMFIVCKENKKVIDHFISVSSAFHANVLFGSAV